MGVHTCNPKNTWEDEAGRLRVWNWFELHRKTLSPPKEKKSHSDQSVPLVFAHSLCSPTVLVFKIFSAVLLLCTYCTPVYRCACLYSGMYIHMYVYQYIIVHT